MTESLALAALPITESLAPKTLVVTLSFWRCTTLAGRTVSARASTSRLSSARVASMSALIWSGSFVIDCPHFL